MSDFKDQARAIVFLNDQSEIHARVAALEFQLEHGEYPSEYRLDDWAQEFREGQKRAVEGLATVLQADHEFMVMVDAFDEEADPDDIAIGLDEYCNWCHDAGCSLCMDPAG